MFTGNCSLASVLRASLTHNDLHRDYLSWVDYTFETNHAQSQHPKVLPGYEDTREDTLTMGTNSLYDLPFARASSRLARLLGPQSAERQETPRSRDCTRQVRKMKCTGT